MAKVIFFIVSFIVFTATYTAEINLQANRITAQCLDSRCEIPLGLSGFPDKNAPEYATKEWWTLWFNQEML